MEKLVQLSITCILLFWWFQLCDSQTKDREVEYVYGYRVINWCVIGKTEPILFEWPLVQLKPFLLKTHGLGKYGEFNTSIPDPNPFPEGDEYDNYEKDLKAALAEPEPPPPKYSLEFKKIRCDDSGKVTTTTIQNTFHNRAHLILKIEEPGNPTYEGVEGLLIQANHAPFGLGFPFGQFDDGEDVQCECNHLHARIIPCLSRPDIEILAPTVAAFHYQLLSFQPSEMAKKVSEKYPKTLQEIGKQKEFHFHYKWHSTPCSPSTTVEFWVLIVHDFFRRKYEIKKFGPYSEFHTDPSPRASMNLSHTAPSKSTTADRIIIKPVFMPAPLFPKCRESIVSDPDCVPSSVALAIRECNETYFVDCHGGPDYFTPPPVEDTKKGRIRLNGEFDAQCISRYRFNRAYRQCPEWTGKMRCAGDYSVLKRLDEGAIKDRRVAKDGELDPFFPDTFCFPCNFEPTTEFVEPEIPGIPFFKRTLHGALMILAFMYFLPLSIIIGRFYKETFHDVELKGWRLWLWIHVGVCIFLMLVCYASYNLPTFWILDRHMYWGYGALFSGAAGLITGWCREKSMRGLKYMLGFHALTGYGAWFCAAISFQVSAASPVAKSIMTFTVIGCLTIMVALTCHVCVVDKKVGMKPSRNHWPVLQVRFEDAFVPGQKFRKIFFYVISGVLFVFIFVTFCV